MAKKSNSKAVGIGVAVIVVLLVGGYSAFEMQKSRREAAETAAAWMITGAPCPAPAAGAAPPSLPRQMEYEEMAISREVASAVNCNTIKENGTGPQLKICQFIGPGHLRVKTAKGTYDFAPGSRDASLVVRDDVPSCVLHVNRALFN